jgi:threonine dehydratase
MAEAVRFLAFEHGLVVEPSGAVGVGALMGGLVRTGSGPTVVIITGRNLSPTLLVDLLAREG